MAYSLSNVGAVKNLQQKVPGKKILEVFLYIHFGIYIFLLFFFSALHNWRKPILIWGLFQVFSFISAYIQKQILVISY